MDNIKIELLALDLDGTTLRSDTTLSAENKKAIRETVKIGVEVVPTTGRVFSEVPKLVKEIEGINYLITANGAAVYDLHTGERVYENPISKGDVKNVLKQMEKYDVMVDAYVAGEVYSLEKWVNNLARYNVPEAYRPMFRDTRVVMNEYLEYKAFLIEHTVEKFVLFFANSEEYEQATILFDKKTPLVATKTMAMNLELNSPTANKWDGLYFLGKKLGINGQHMMTVGDGENDYEMIKYAGLSVAMENADKALKKNAAYITKSNDNDGVAYALDRFVLRACEGRQSSEMDSEQG